MELNGLCKNCLGCQKLEDKNFKGTYNCEWNNYFDDNKKYFHNYRKVVKDE